MGDGEQAPDIGKVDEGNARVDDSAFQVTAVIGVRLAFGRGNRRSIDVMKKQGRANGGRSE